MNLAPFVRVLSVLAVAAALLLAGCTTGPLTAGGAGEFNAEIKRTSYGIPHVVASDYKGLGYGMGYVYAQDNFCQFAEKITQLNGEVAKHFGPNKLVTAGAGPAPNIKAVDSDFFNRIVYDKARIAALWAKASQASRDLAEGYAAGYNRYLADTGPANLPAACRNGSWVRPITTSDLYLLYAGLVTLAGSQGFAQAFVDASPPQNVAATTLPDTAPGSALATLSAPELLAQAGQAMAQTNPLLDGLGSNGWSFGKDATANGRGLMLQNTHWPWVGMSRWSQIHTTIPGTLDAMGVAIGGTPAVLYGFNQSLAWSLTVATGPRYLIRELTLGPTATSYIVDGVTKEMTARSITVEVNGAASQTRTYYSTEYGPMIKFAALGLDWKPKQAFAFTDPNLPNNRIWDDALALAKAPTAEVARVAHGRILGYPLVNTLMTDSTGDAVYMDYSVKPYVEDVKLAACALPGVGQTNTAAGRPVLDGAKSACNPDTDASAPQAGIMPPSKLPFLRRSDFVVNANNTYWMTNPAQPITGVPSINGAPVTDLGLRARMNLLTVMDRLAGRDGLAGNKVTPDIVQAMLTSSDSAPKLGNRSMAAELTMPAVVSSLCPGLGDVTMTDKTVVNVAAACSVLSQWDRRYNPESVGNAVFREFFRQASTIGAAMWSVPFSATDPVNTPREPNLGDPAIKLKWQQALGTSVQKLSAAGIALNTPWKDLLYTTVQGKKLATGGGSNLEGLPNIMEARLAAPGLPAVSASGYNDVTYGSGYVSTVGFDDAGPVAHAVLIHGQSSNPESPYYYDQMAQLWTQRKWHRLPFTAAQIAADPKLTVLRLKQ